MYAETTSQSELTFVELAPFKGSWVEATETITYGENGRYQLSIQRVADEASLLFYENNDIRMWKTGAEFMRPKWGIYRSLNNSQQLQDEEVRFADFSIQEVDPTPCGQTWFTTLPTTVQESIHWYGDHEEGTLNDWTMEQWLYPGGGVFNTGEPEVAATTDNAYAHSGCFAAKGTINNAWQAQNGNRAVRLMRWTNTAWDNGGDYFPKESTTAPFIIFHIPTIPISTHPGIRATAAGGIFFSSSRTMNLAKASPAGG